MVEPILKLIKDRLRKFGISIYPHYVTMYFMRQHGVDIGNFAIAHDKVTFSLMFESLLIPFTVYLSDRNWINKITKFVAAMFDYNKKHVACLDYLINQNFQVANIYRLQSSLPNWTWHHIPSVHDFYHRRYHGFSSTVDHNYARLIIKHDSDAATVLFNNTVVMYYNGEAYYFTGHILSVANDIRNAILDAKFPTQESVCDS